MANNQPTAAYIGASWAVMLIGVLSYCFGLWNAQTMMLNEKGYYFAMLLLGVYSAISLQKTIRDRAEGIPTSNQYYLISWVALIVAVAMQLIGLWNANLSMSEKGFYLMTFTMSLFASITIQKNVRDLKDAEYDDDYGQIGHTPSMPVLDNEERQSILQSPFRRDKD